MRWFVMYLVLLVLLSLSPGSVVTASGQEQIVKIKVLERGDN